ncbi:hypothetical protein Q428_00800 [Fervidicella metallireducens AeB]|uniref:N-acetyltransferase domain-containing protein n=1 Tax=Fervidicella metallireducens AeB TaxID=1403537 RepID=A0A017RZ72_9CLOT|nr:GNAT family N-acetyltransferase [Fervidicella metallireducens]EYE89891.1 hypothetical protein Q428_00800 [Fervidicella metallireducens AeB]
MPHYATILDYKRLIKYVNLFFLDEKLLSKVYSSGDLVVSDFNPMNFCYPIKYYDGTLIRYFSSDSKDILDMCIFLSSKLTGKIYVPHIPKELYESFIPYGFTIEYKIESLYKYCNSTNTNKNTCQFVNYTNTYYEALRSIDSLCFPKPMLISKNDVLDLLKDKNTIFRICIYDNLPVGFSLLKINNTIEYGSISKIAVKPDYQNQGIGSMILQDISETLRFYNIFIIFVDNIFESSTNFFLKNKFKRWSVSYLLSKHI